MNPRNILLFLSITTSLFLNASYTNKNIEALKENKECLACDLSFWSAPHSDFSGYKLNESTFNFSNLANSDITGAILERASMQNTLLIDSWLSGSDFSGVSGEGANFHGANASGANFTNANLMGAFFYKTKLLRVDFTRTNLAHADLSDADLSEAILTDTQFHYTYCNEKTILPKEYHCNNNWVEKILNKKTQLQKKED